MSSFTWSHVGCLALVVMSLTVPAAAAEPTPPKPDTFVMQPAPTTPPAPAPILEAAQPSRSPFRYIAIAAILGGFVAFAWRSRRRAFTHPAHPTGKLALLDSIRISPQAQLVVVSVGGRTLLLSVTGTSVRRVAPLPDWPLGKETPEEAAVDSARDEARLAYAPTVAPPSFGDMLRRFVTNLDTRAAPSPALQIADETVDRVELRPRTPSRAVYSEPSAPPPAAVAARSARRPRTDEPLPVRKSSPLAPAPSMSGAGQASGLLARRSARGA